MTFLCRFPFHLPSDATSCALRARRWGSGGGDGPDRPVADAPQSELFVTDPNGLLRFLRLGEKAREVLRGFAEVKLRQPAVRKKDAADGIAELTLTEEQRRDALAKAAEVDRFWSVAPDDLMAQLRADP